MAKPCQLCAVYLSVCDITVCSLTIISVHCATRISAYDVIILQVFIAHIILFLCQKNIHFYYCDYESCHANQVSHVIIRLPCLFNQDVRATP